MNTGHENWKDDEEQDDVEEVPEPKIPLSKYPFIFSKEDGSQVLVDPETRKMFPLSKKCDDWLVSHIFDTETSTVRFILDSFSQNPEITPKYVDLIWSHSKKVQDIDDDRILSAIVARTNGSEML